MIDPTAARIVVLLVDDQAFTGSVVGMMLQPETDIELRCCLSARDAVAMANELAPALILQDLVMPELDGLALVGLFRNNPQTSGTSIVVLSANDDAATRSRALAAGADGYLVKLPPKADLVACIRQQAARSAGGKVTTDPVVIERFHEAGAPDFARLLIDQFLQEAFQRVRALTEASGDTAALNNVAHSLKGSAMMMGASRLGALCGRVEDQSAATSAVPPALLTEIERELAHVQQALTAHRERIGRA